MKFLVLLIVVLNLLCVSCHSDGSVNNYSEGLISQWINYWKRLSLVVSILSGVILYYIPDSRSYARRGCCLLIDNFAEGLKTVLCLKENEVDFIKENFDDVDSFISEDFYDNNKLRSQNSSNDFEDLKPKEKKKESRKQILKPLKSDSKQFSASHHRHNQKYRRLRNQKKERDLSKKYSYYVLTSNSDQIDDRNLYFMMDNKITKSDIFPTENWVSSVTRENEKIKTERNDFDIARSKTKKFNEERVNENYDQENLKLGKELDKPFNNVSKMATTKTVILKNADLKSSFNSGKIKNIKNQLNEEYGNKTKVFVEPTPRIKHQLTESNDSIELKLYHEIEDEKNELNHSINKEQSFTKNEVTKRGETLQQQYQREDKELIIKKEKKDDTMKNRKENESDEIIYIIESDLKKMMSQENYHAKKELRRKRRQNSENCFQNYEETPIPIFTNRLKPVISRAFGWLFGRCPHANENHSVNLKY